MLEPSDSSFIAPHFETQGLDLLCGLCSVNNLLGTHRYSEQDLNSISETLSTMSGQRHQHCCCRGDYDANVLIKSLEDAECKTRWVDGRKKFSLSQAQKLAKQQNQYGSLFGFLINKKHSGSLLTSIFSRLFCMSSRHWLCVKKTPNWYLLMDSNLNEPTRISPAEIEQVLEQMRKNQAEIILVSSKEMNVIGTDSI